MFIVYYYNVLSYSERQKQTKKPRHGKHCITKVIIPNNNVEFRWLTGDGDEDDAADERKNIFFHEAGLLN